MSDDFVLVEEGDHPARLGSYRIVRKIAEGGMGAVYEAEQENPRRRVALKVVRPGADSDALRARFEHEAQILGQLHHPGIAQIYEAGAVETPRGSMPFFAMELVIGRPLTEFADHNKLDTRGRLELVLRICDALQHAHEKGVIHRDLKPANILVDDSGAPKILDFGVARATNSDVVAVTMHTTTGQMLGTVPYMSPEQVSADPTELDARSDVYALGVIVYELLAGRMPYELRQMMLHEAVRVIREVEAAPLSTANRALRGDLETIVGKALDKEKTRRYGSAAELGADIDRFLRNEPIVARRPSAMYQFRKFARRNRVLVGGISTVFVVLVAGVIVSATQAVRATRAERDTAASLAETKVAKALAESREKEARTEAAKLVAVNSFLETMLSSADPHVSGNRDVTVREIAEDARKAVDNGSLKDEPAVEASVKRTLGWTYSSLAMFDVAEPFLRDALAYYRANFDARSEEVADSEHKLASVLHSQSKLDEAETLLASAMETHRQHDGESSALYAGDLALRANIRYFEGRFDDGIADSRGALEIRREVYGDHDYVVARSMQELAFHLMEKRDFAAAEPLLLEALELYREFKGPNHPSVARALLELGRLYTFTRNREKAESFLLEALDAAKHAWGDDHPYVADVLVQLSDFSDGPGGRAEAESRARQALAIRRKALGEHRDTATAMTVLGDLLDAEGKSAEAEPLLREALEMRLEIFGDRSAAVGDSLRRLSRNARTRGDLEEAESLLRGAIDVWGETIGKDHPDYARVLIDLARMLRARNDLAGAESLFREALEIQRKRLGDANSDVFENEDDLARTLLSEEKWSDAEPVIRELLDAEARRFGATHASVAHVNIMLGRVLAANGRFEEAETLMLPAWETLKGNSKLWLETKVLALERIAALYEAWGKVDEAAKWKALAEEYRAKGPLNTLR